MNRILLVFIILIFGCSREVLPKRYPIECSNLQMDSILRVDTFKNKSPIIFIQYFVLYDTISKVEEKFTKTIITEATIELNRVYQDSIKFIQLDTVTFINNSHDLTHYYLNYVQAWNSNTPLNEIEWHIMTNQYNNLSCLNVYIVKSDELIFGSELLGFTPNANPNLISKEQFKTFYSTIGVSFKGFLRFNTGTSLIHEIGHYLGLKHPWDYTPEQLLSFGIDTDMEKCTNYMNYNCFIDHFTKEQLMYQKNYWLTYRN